MSRITRLVAAFVRDAQLNGRVALTVEPVPDEKYPGARVTDPRGGSMLVTSDAHAEPEDDVAAVDFDGLQEMVIFYRAEVLGIFGPWPACPLDGHRHKLGVAAEHGNRLLPTWVCPTGSTVRRVGELDPDSVG